MWKKRRHRTNVREKEDCFRMGKGILYLKKGKRDRAKEN